MVEQLGERVGTLEEAIDHLAALTGPHTFLAAEMELDIIRESEMIGQMTEACLKGEASTQDFVTLLNVTNLKGVPDEETYIESDQFDRTNGVYLIELYYTIYSQDTLVYEVESIPYWENPASRDRKLMEYVGPSYVIYNRTNDCVKGLPKRSPHHITSRCTEAYHEDPALNNWQEVEDTRTDYEQLKQPRVIQSLYETIVSCPFHQIKYDEEHLDCPPYAFKSLVLKAFAIFDHVYEVKIEPIVIQEKDYVIIAPKLEKGVGNRHWNQLINKAYMDKRDSLPVRRFGYNQETISLPFKGWVIVKINNPIIQKYSTRTYRRLYQ